MGFVAVPKSEMGKVLEAIADGRCVTCYGPITNECGGDHEGYCHDCDDGCSETERFDKVNFDITLSVHTSRNRGRRVSSMVDMWAGGVFLQWLHPFESGAQSVVVAYAREHGKRINFSKRHDTWRLPNANEVCQAFWGTSLRDELVRAISSESRVYYAPSKPGYVVGAGRLLEFYHSRCRDRRLGGAVRLKECCQEVKDFLLECATGEKRLISGLTVRDMVFPAVIPRVRLQWKCDTCGKNGFREAFRQRSIPGLAGSAGLDCPACPEREVSAVESLLAGTPRGLVVPQKSTVLLPAW